MGKCWSCTCLSTLESSSSELASRNTAALTEDRQHGEGVVVGTVHGPSAVGKREREGGVWVVTKKEGANRMGNCSNTRKKTATSSRSHLSPAKNQFTRPSLGNVKGSL